MPIYKASLIFPMDSALPRDQVSLHPHFSANDPQILGDWLKGNLNSWAPVAGKPFTVKIYKAERQVPNYPVYTTQQANPTPNSTIPREIALCLSYYGGYNRPRSRGRFYLPAMWIAGTPALRPTGAIMANAMTFATEVLRKNAPQATYWTMWSPTEQREMGTVLNWWVDDEWDTVRSRGLRSTTRVTGSA